MRSLFVTQLSPWHRHGGAQQRQRVMLNALDGCGEVDVVILGARTGPDVVEPPENISIRYLDRPRSPSRVDVLRWLATGTAPSALLRYDICRLRADLDALESRLQYDLFWSSRLIPLLILGRLANRVILDLDDLEDQKFRQRLPTVRDVVRSRRPRAAFHRALAKRDASAWEKQQDRQSQAADAILVCSDDDQARLSAPRTSVVPNGAYEPRTVVDHRNLRSSEPTITLQGGLGYAPNTDAALILVCEVSPRVRAALPGLRVRLVGEAPPEVHALHDPPAVTVTGPVPDMSAELCRTDLVAVPLRSGSGTRLKIIEAFAHGVPVVASSIAVDGLGARDGTHLLMRDHPEAFATACINLLARPDLRALCIENGMALYRSRYRWACIEQRVRRLVRDTVRR
jgi:glycosyltransferase involved in cell wall biosynthesis